MSLIKSLFYLELVCLGFMAIGVVGHKTNLVPFKFAFGGFALALLVILVLVLVAVVTVILSYFLISKEPRSTAWVIAGIGILPVVVIGLMVGPGLKAPKIHDISTDTVNNIHFSHAKTLRDASENSIELPSSEVVRMQLGYYSLAPLVVDDSVEQALGKVQESIEGLGWRITHVDEASAQIEAIEETAVFGFVDDIVVRITGAPEGSGSVIDTRSVSRVGVSDLGANAARIERFQYGALASVIDGFLLPLYLVRLFICVVCFLA